MKFCESESGVDYAFAMATNSQLKLRALMLLKSQADYEQRLAPVTALMETLFSPDDKPEAVSQLVPEATWYRSLCYKTQESWSRARRVVTKVCYGSEGLELRHVVTSLPAAKILHPKFIQINIVPEGRWRIAGKSNNLIYLPTGLPPKHLRVINLDFGCLQWLMS
jgi:streptomycin 6-kinase